MAGLSLCLLVAVGAVTWSLVDSDPYVAPRPPADRRTRSTPGAASDTLRALELAVRRGGPRRRPRRWRPRATPPTARHLVALVDNAEAIDVA